MYLPILAIMNSTNITFLSMSFGEHIYTYLFGMKI